MKNSYSLLLFLLSCIPFGSFASTTWKLQNVEYRVDTLSHVVIGPGTTQTTLMLEGPVKLRVFYTTTDMTNPNVNLKLIMGKIDSKIPEGPVAEKWTNYRTCRHPIMIRKTSILLV